MTTVQTEPIAAELQTVLRGGADRRAILLCVLAARRGELQRVLLQSGLVGEVAPPALQQAYEKVKALVEPELVAEVSRVCETPRAHLLVGLFAQLRHVAEFVSSDEDSLPANLAAVERLLQSGRADLFLH